MIPIKQAERILKKYEPLDLCGSLDIIYYLGEQEDDIIFKGRGTTPDRLLNRIYGGYHPRNIEIRFFGGPPEHGAWHDASVYAYLLDRVARIIALHGVVAATKALKYGIKYIN